jgi:HAD superfamily hydrolase (TIGR01509 family)
VADLAGLVRDVELLSLDAGNTVIFLDHARVAAICEERGFATSAEAIERAEGKAKHAQELGALVDFRWKHETDAKSRSWAAMIGTMLSLAGLAHERVPAVVDSLWEHHCARNLWSLVPPGLLPSLGRARGAGVPVVVVSNSEGMLEALFEDLGLGSAFDFVIDSGVVGIEKPDPRIFDIALGRFRVPASRTLHLGDNFATDVLGARAAGIPVALVDPFRHLAGRHADVPRVPGAREVADAIADARRYR